MITGAATVQTAGAALTVIKHTGFRISKLVTLEHPFGIDLYGCRGVTATEFRLYGVSGSALVDESALLRIGPQLNDDASYTMPWWSAFSDFVIGGNYQVDYGIEINAADGLFFSNGYIASAYDALVQLEADIVSPTNSSGVMFNNIYFDGVTSATGTLQGMVFEEDNGAIDVIKVSNSLFGNFQTYCVVIPEDSTARVSFSGCDFTNTATGAINIDSTSSAHVVIDGNIFRNCRTDADSGAVINAANSNTITITNNQFQNTAATAAWGVIWSGTHNQGICSNNSFENFSDGDIGLYAVTFNDEYKQVGNTTDAALVLEDLGGRTRIVTLADEATPSILIDLARHRYYLSGGTTTITDFDDGVTGHVITVIAEHSLDITDGTNIFLSGSANWSMTATDTLTLICKTDNKWYEISRGDNGE